MAATKKNNQKNTKKSQVRKHRIWGSDMVDFGKVVLIISVIVLVAAGIMYLMGTNEVLCHVWSTYPGDCSSPLNGIDVIQSYIMLPLGSLGVIIGLLSLIIGKIKEHYD